MTTAAATGAVIGVAGWKNSGKTTLVVRLVEELTRRGLKVATVKHAHHAFQVDERDADSARHRRAGASQVTIVGQNRWAMITELNGEPEPTLAEMLSRLDPCDLVIVEGYKGSSIPKIEARRLESAKGPKLSGDPERNVIAIAADHRIEGEILPVFALDDVASLADFVLKRLQK